MVTASLCGCAKSVFRSQATLPYITYVSRGLACMFCVLSVLTSTSQMTYSSCRIRPVYDARVVFGILHPCYQQFENCDKVTYHIMPCFFRKMAPFCQITGFRFVFRFAKLSTFYPACHFVKFAKLLVHLISSIARCPLKI